MTEVAEVAERTAPWREHFDVDDCGSIVTFTPKTDAAAAWLQENVYSDEWQWPGGALCVDHRYADELLCGIAEAFA